MFSHMAAIFVLRRRGGGGSVRIEPLRQLLDYCTQKRNNKRKVGKPKHQ